MFCLLLDTDYKEVLIVRGLRLKKYKDLPRRFVVTAYK